MRRVAVVVAIVIGVTLIGFTFAEHLFSRSRDAQRVADQYAPLMSAKGLRDLSTGFDAVKSAGAELGTSAEPRLQQALGMSDAQFAEYVAQEMPGIAKFDAQTPDVVELVGPVIGKMQAVRALVAVGLGIAIAPLVIGIPGKVDAAVRVTEIGRIGLAPETGQKAVGATALFDGMAADVHTKLQPALDEHLGAGAFAQQFPKLATWVDSWQGTISAQSHELSDSQMRFASTFANADNIPLEPIPWMFIIPGLALALLAGLTLLPARRPAEAPVPAPTRVASSAG